MTAVEASGTPPTIHRCQSCGAHQHLWQNRYCTHCWSRDLTAMTASGSASLLSWATYHADFGLPAPSAPYHIGFVELDEGPRMPCHLTGDLSTARFQQAISVITVDHLPTGADDEQAPRPGLTAYVTQDN